MLEAGGLVEEATGNLPGNKGVGMEEVADDNKRPQVKIEDHMLQFCKSCKTHSLQNNI